MSSFRFLILFLHLGHVDICDIKLTHHFVDWCIVFDLPNFVYISDVCVN